MQIKDIINENMGSSIEGVFQGLGDSVARGAVQQAIRYIQQDRFSEGWNILAAQIKSEHRDEVKEWAKKLPNNLKDVSSSKIVKDPAWNKWFDQVWEKLKTMVK